MVQFPISAFGASTFFLSCISVLLAGRNLELGWDVAACKSCTTLLCLQELAYELEDMQVALDNLLAILSKAMGGAC